MTDWTAITGITGIVVSGVVGPTVAARLAASNQAKAAENAIALADRGAARTLLADAALAVREAIGKAGWLREALWKWEEKLGREDLVTDAETHAGVEELKAFQTAAQRVDLLEQQVTIMFGQGHPVAAAYTACGEALSRVARASYQIPALHEYDARLQEEIRHGSIDASEEPTTDELYRQYARDIVEGFEQSDDAHRRFLEAAHEAIGVRA